MPKHDCLADEILAAYSACKCPERRYFNPRAENVYCTQCSNFEFRHPGAAPGGLPAILSAEMSGHAGVCPGIKLSALRQRLNRFRGNYDRASLTCNGCGLDLSVVGEERAIAHLEKGCPWAGMEGFLERRRKIRPGPEYLFCRVCKAVFQETAEAEAHDIERCEPDIPSTLPAALKKYFGAHEDYVYCIYCERAGNGHRAFHDAARIERHAREGCIRVHGKAEIEKPY